MKLQKFTCAAVLSALVLGAVGPTAFALEDEARELTGKATIRYQESDTPPNTGNEVLDPENPEEKIEVDEENGTNNNDKKGALRVDFVSNLKFGEQDITTGAGEYFASATEGLKVEGKTPVKRGNFIQVTDQRADGQLGWTLSAEVTTPFTNDNGILDGAEITYTLPYVNSTQKVENRPTAETLVTLDTSGGSETMASAANGIGWGSHTIEYGRPALDAAGEVVEDGVSSVDTEATMEEAVKLSVPANSPLDQKSAYVAEVTWTIANL